MEGLDEVGQEELRLHTSQLSVGCVGEIAEDDPACLECLHGGIAFVLLGQSLQENPAALPELELHLIRREDGGEDHRLFLQEIQEAGDPALLIRQREHEREGADRGEEPSHLGQGGREIGPLLMKARAGREYLRARRQTISDWAWTPWRAQKTATAPSMTRRDRSTSAVKSMCPGVSRMVYWRPFQGQVRAALTMEMPRSRSCRR